MPPAPFTVAVEGATLAGETSGDGRAPLILLHGMAGERRDWNRLLAALPADFCSNLRDRFTGALMAGFGIGSRPLEQR